MMGVLTDTHAHLHLPSFAADRQAVLQRAREAGVTRILIPALQATEWPLMKQLHYAGRLYFAVGWHPHALPPMEPTIPEDPQIHAIGEIGLDYVRSPFPRERQREALEAQLQLALRRRLPVVLHCRDAYADLRALLAAFPGLRGIQHCFSGGPQDAEWLWERGFLVSFAGNLTYPRNEALRQIFRSLPPEAILLETDSPYLPPQPYRGQRNEPAHIRVLYEFAAKLRNITIEELAAIVAQNFCTLMEGSACAEGS